MSLQVENSWKKNMAKLDPIEVSADDPSKALEDAYQEKQQKQNLRTPSFL